jgi:hypothetical protein
MELAEIHDLRGAARRAPAQNGSPVALTALSDAGFIGSASSAHRVHQIWPIFAVGLGLTATVAWLALFGWLLYRAVPMLLA